MFLVKTTRSKLLGQLFDRLNNLRKVGPILFQLYLLMLANQIVTSRPNIIH